MDKGLAQVTEALKLFSGDVVFLCVDVAYQHIARTDQKSGQHTGHKQVAHIQANGIGKHDHGDGRRDDRTDGTGRNHNGIRPALLIAAFAQRIQGQHRQSGGIGIGGTGKACQQDTGQLHGMGNAATDPAHGCVGKIQQRLGDLGSLHNITGQHKEGNGQHGKAVAGIEVLLGKDHKG